MKTWLEWHLTVIIHGKGGWNMEILIPIENLQAKNSCLILSNLAPSPSKFGRNGQFHMVIVKVSFNLES